MWEIRNLTLGFGFGFGVWMFGCLSSGVLKTTVVVGEKKNKKNGKRTKREREREGEFILKFFVYIFNSIYMWHDFIGLTSTCVRLRQHLTVKG